MNDPYQIWRLSLASLPAGGVDNFIRQAALAGITCYHTNGSYLVMLFDTPRSSAEVVISRIVGRAASAIYRLSFDRHRAKTIMHIIFHRGYNI